jgi:hypothetical protein
MLIKGIWLLAIAKTLERNGNAFIERVFKQNTREPSVAKGTVAYEPPNSRQMSKGICLYTTARPVESRSTLDRHERLSLPMQNPVARS